MTEPSYLKPIYILTEDERLASQISERLKPYRKTIVKYVTQLAVATMHEMPSVLILDFDQLGETGLECIRLSRPNFLKAVDIVLLSSSSDLSLSSGFEDIRHAIKLDKQHLNMLGTTVAQIYKLRMKESCLKQRA